ncbi:Gfo/Idh/MocA family oxidoreductase [Sphingobium sp.]|uniref:Gfo/Idh/MocA family protein n=1 Tax=Sphingobium sp. TaxID=1912891 RepID=UPI0028BEA7EE|nr:Gfo/Idh/MocA family oxidoreductase [Sphingobium sp.]
MTRRPLRVGIVGVSPDRGWASMAHIPAIQSLPEHFRLAAVCTRSLESASKAAAFAGVPLAFDDPAEMAAHPDIDFITVTVKAPGHQQVLSQVFETGKPVLCEWPVGNEDAVTRQLADAAQKRGIPTFVGLQSRFIPAFRYLRDLINAGEVGRLLSINLLSTAASWGPVVHPDDAYTLDDRNGATLLRIWGGHTLDMLWHCLGDFTEASVMTGRQRRFSEALGRGDRFAIETPDNVLINARLDGGAIASIHLRGGPHPGTAFRLEAVGEDGVVTVEGDGPFAMVMGELCVRVARKGDDVLTEVSIPDAYYRSGRTLPAVVLNVAEEYAAIAEALAGGEDSTVSFRMAADRRDRLAALAASASSAS